MKKFLQNAWRRSWAFVTLRFLPGDVRQELNVLIRDAVENAAKHGLKTGRERREWVVKKITAPDSAIGRRAQEWVDSWGGDWILDIMIKILVAEERPNNDAPGI